MSKCRKQDRRKRRRDKRDKSKKSPAGIPETKTCPAIGYDELQEEIKDLLLAPGATMWFFDENGERQIKLKIKA